METSRFACRLVIEMLLHEFLENGPRANRFERAPDPRDVAYAMSADGFEHETVVAALDALMAPTGERREALKSAAPMLLGDADVRDLLGPDVYAAAELALAAIDHTSERELLTRIGSACRMSSAAASERLHEQLIRILVEADDILWTMSEGYAIDAGTNTDIVGRVRSTCREALAELRRAHGA